MSELKPPFLAAAEPLLARGWFVHPLMPGRKVPASGHGQDDGTNSLQRVTEWSQYAGGRFNVGVSTERSGLYVIDVDSSGDKVGEKSWADLISKHGHVDTFTVRTHSGGLHYYYRMPDPKLRNTASKLGKDIDTRGNGYVVGPGSTIERSGTYTVELDLPVADLPLWMIDVLTPPARFPFMPSGEDATEDETHERARELASELAACDSGANNLAARLASMAGQYVGAGQIDAHVVRDIFLSAIADWSWNKDSDYRTMVGTIERQINYGAQNPRPWGKSRTTGTLEEFELEEADTTSEGTNEMSWEELKLKFKNMGFDIEDPEAKDYFTDARQAEQFCSFSLKDKNKQPLFCYTPTFGWLKWTGKVWENCPDSTITERVRRWTTDQTDRAVNTARKLIEKAAPAAAENPEKARKILGDASDAGKFLVIGWKNRQAAARMEAIAKLARGLMTVNKPFDQNPDVINTQSGIVDLRTGNVRQALPSDLCRKITEAHYEKGYTHPDWEKSLEAVPTGTLDWFQRFMGQAVTGYANREDQMAIFYGSGMNGKSLVVKSVKDAIGKYYASLSDRALMGGQTHPTELMALYGARIAVLEETEEDGRMNMQRIKKIVGTDAGITARYIAKDEVTFDPTHTLIINTNHLPVIEDNGMGAWRRLLAVPFPYTFLKEHETPTEDFHRDGDVGIKPRMSGANQRKAVLSWLIAGAVKWYAQGQVMGSLPKEVEEATSAWQEEADLFSGFMRDGNVFLVPSAHVTATDLLESFNYWLQSSGNKPWAARTLRKRLEGSALLSGKVRTARIRAGQPGLSRPSDDFTVPSGQYTAWYGLSFAPVISVRPSIAQEN